jgi:hypothetical protein
MCSYFGIETQMLSSSRLACSLPALPLGREAIPTQLLWSGSLQSVHLAKSFLMVGGRFLRGGWVDYYFSRAELSVQYPSRLKVASSPDWFVVFCIGGNAGWQSVTVLRLCSQQLPCGSGKALRPACQCLKCQVVFVNGRQLRSRREKGKK